MDGLTISNANTLLDRGQTLKEIRDTNISTPPNATNSPSGTDGAGKSFADTLKDAVKSVNDAQQVADVKMQEIATGKNHNIPEVMIAAEKADIQLKLMVQVRNKIIEAYQEVMKMQV
jgi:flagellar hook-basal body complex protein FliE